MKKTGLIFTFFFIVVSEVFPQGEIDDQKKLFYRNERTIGATLSSVGYGGSFRYSKRINFFNQRIYEAEISIIKHPKEIKTVNSWYPNNKRFVFGKLNFFFNVRAGIGFQRIKYKKIDKGGIAIRFLYTGGLSLGFYKPVYYEVFKAVGGMSYIIVTQKFNSSIDSPYDILSRASFFKGFDEIKLVPGLYGRIGINFEFGKRDPVISALEVGAMLDAYIKKIPIMASDDNKQFFPAIYASFRFGKIIDIKSETKLKYEEEKRQLY